DAVVLGLAERNDDTQAVHGAALEDRNQLFAPRRDSVGERGPGEERGCEAKAHERKRAVLQENSARDHVFPRLSTGAGAPPPARTNADASARIYSPRLVMAEGGYRV